MPDLLNISPPALSEIADGFKHPAEVMGAMEYALTRAVEALVAAGFDLVYVVDAVTRMTAHPPKEQRT